MNPIDALQATIELRIFEYLGGLMLESGSMDPALVDVITDILKVMTVSTFCLLIVILLIWLERKVIARMQDRVGPNRVGGKYGLGQTVADVLKLLTKEDIIPFGADSLTYNIAPLLIVMTALLMWAVMPFSSNAIGVDLNLGLFYVLSISSISVVSLLLAGWGSNNKYALLGAFRSVAQLVSYEVPMILSLLVPMLLARTMSMQSLITEQDIPYVLVVPLSALIFFISALAETGRSPFDLLEAESEIVAGFHVEYSGMKFAMFFLAEFVSTLFMASLFITIYWGGWRFYLLEWLSGGQLSTVELMVGGWNLGPLLGMVTFFVKTFFGYFLFIWARGTFPRVRIDQMMDFNWKFLVPLSAMLVAVVAIIDRIFLDVPPFAEFLLQLGGNLILGIITIEILRRVGRRRREAEEGSRQDGPAEAAEHHDHHDHHEMGHAAAH
ncbi:MAG: NADH-quinone oxidoreductase subunit NuoH [Anaerolineales bacterium]|nr:NADH-quinone oxidoreductase subunit NuoH [Anaerolineales bacterium]MCB8959263.1 NADH-quinone oxidoreductase subunit NuoH [Ardenticatenales bacterium]